MTNKISFDLQLSNSIFKANLDSLLKISQDNITLIRNKFEDYISRSTKGPLLPENQKNNDFSEFTHVSNIDWILLNSIYVGIYSHFERHMFALARIIEERSKSEIQINDLTGKGINRFLQYIRKVGKIRSIDPSSNPWQEVLIHQKVRNIIVHTGGLLLNDSTQKLENHECFKFLIKNNVIMAGNLGHIRIKKIDIIRSFINSLADVSDRLCNEIREKYPEK